MVRHGEVWTAADGRPLAEREAARLAALLRALAVAPAVDSYGAAAGVPLLTVETARGRIELVRDGERYARRDRAVRYRLFNRGAAPVAMICEARPAPERLSCRACAAPPCSPSPSPSSRWPGPGTPRLTRRSVPPSPC